jgi:hypothetical protein
VGRLRSRISRHFGTALTETSSASRDDVAASLVARAAAAEIEVPPPEFTGRDYLICLLHVAAEIEHSLMVRYLFTAYSLGGPDVPENRRADVRAWQETTLGIVNEEMGHLITIQNLLTALGAPLNFNRKDYPHGSAFYPSGFTLQPANLGSLATYVCAESPQEWDDEGGTHPSHLRGDVPPARDRGSARGRPRRWRPTSAPSRPSSRCGRSPTAANLSR